MAQLTALAEATDTVRTLASRALVEPLQMMCAPPLGKDSYPYGDLVPLGFVLFAMDTAAEELHSHDLAADADAVRGFLLARRSRGLWAYQSGALETSIDSAFVLLGMTDAETVRRLEQFSDGAGGYVPQLHTTALEPGKMTVRDSLRHWCRADYSIACLIRALRRRHGLETVTPLSLLEAGFETRGGLYLANPYFADWLLALAVQDDPGADSLRAKLRNEVIASASPEGHFGSFDVALSTALAVLSLKALHVDVEAHQDALNRLVESGTSRRSTPFYSTEKVLWSREDPWTLLHLMQTGEMRQLIRSEGQEHAITFYRDPHDLVASSLILMALLGGPRGNRFPALDQPPHLRYLVPQEAYIAEFALPPYLNAEADA